MVVRWATGLRGGEKLAGSWSLRAVVILPLSLVLFGVLIERAGFVPAMMVLIFEKSTSQGSSEEGTMEGAERKRQSPGLSQSASLDWHRSLSTPV